LRFYTWSLREFEGGYLPPGIDEFLIDRLASSEGKPEETAIIDSHIRQGSGRWGESASRSHETFQKRRIDNIMSRLDGMNDLDAVSAMVFIESLRALRGTGLDAPRVHPIALTIHTEQAIHTQAWRFI
jgi:hypothetical protein